MFKLDIQLYQLLVKDPRMSYRELARHLGTSTPAIHKRMQALNAAGILRTSTIISTSYLNATVVSVYGHPEEKQPMEEIINNLRQNDCFGGAMFCSSNMLFVTGILRRSIDMESFHNFVRTTCQMKDSTLAIDYLNEFDKVGPTPSPLSEVGLSTLDLKIVNSIHFDARRSYGEIASEVGVTARTVRKHIERMVEEGSIEIWTVLNPSANPDFFTTMQVQTKEGVDRTALGIDLMRRFPGQVALFRTFCNIPDMIFLGTSHSTMSNLHETMKQMESDDRIICVVPHVLVVWWWSESWRDKIITGRKEMLIWPNIP